MGIFKKANNIYITVRDTYTSISGSSYEEAEEVIIEATNGDLELVSQKKVIMQGLGNNSDIQETEEQDTGKEKVINAPCVVHFRPLPSWRGEFGFDWFRDGKDAEYGLKNEEGYSKTIESGYGEKKELTSKEAIEQLKNEYENIELGTKDGKKTIEYFVPYLTLFSKQFVKNNLLSLKAKDKSIILPCYTATLQVVIEVFEEMEKLEIIPEDNSIHITEIILQKKGKKNHSNTLIPKLLKKGDIIKCTITVTCNIDLESDIPINVYAWSKGYTAQEDKKLVGKLLILQNDKAMRREEKIVLVEVTLIDFIRKGKLVSGSFFQKDKQILRQTLHQALIIPIIKEEKLDLSDNEKYQKGKDSHITELGFAKYSYKKEDVPKPIYNIKLYTDTKEIFENKKNDKGELMKDKYREYFTVFMFPILSNDPIEGAAQDINIKNAIIFTADDPNDPINMTPNPNQNKLKNYATVAHEVLHGLGLYHTQRDKKSTSIKEGQKYIYFSNDKGEYFVTNIMRYGEKEKEYSLHYWQWNIINKNREEILKKHQQTKVDSTNKIKY